MIEAFKQILNYKTDDHEDMNYDETFIEERVNKFAKHFQHL